VPGAIDQDGDVGIDIRVTTDEIPRLTYDFVEIADKGRLGFIFVVMRASAAADVRLHADLYCIPACVIPPNANQHVPLTYEICIPDRIVPEE
jgi:hypothetical protein